MQGSLTPPTVSPPKYMTSREAAQYTRMNRDWFNALVRQGLIPYAELPHPNGGTPQRRYDRDALDAFMAERMVNAPAVVPTPATDPSCDLDGEALA